MSKGDMRRPAQIPATEAQARYSASLGEPVARPCPNCGSKSLTISYSDSAQRVRCSRCRHLISEVPR